MAKQQRYDDAVAAYDRALRLQPGMADAVANRATVDAARKRSPSPGDGQGKPSQQGRGDQASSGAKSDSSDGKKAGQPPQASPSSQGASTPSSGKPDQAQARKDAPPPRTPPKPSPDPATQAAADAAQRERMRAAIGEQKAHGAEQASKNAPAVQSETAEQRERRQAVDAWLRRVPDEPGALLKAKFRLEHERRQKEGR